LPAWHPRWRCRRVRSCRGSTAADRGPTSSLGDPTIPVAQLLRPYPQYTSVSQYRNNVGTTIYHGVYAKVEQRSSKGRDLHGSDAEGARSVSVPDLIFDLYQNKNQ